MASAIALPEPPKPGVKKSKFESMKDLVVKYKKSCVACVGVVIVIVILLIVWAHHQPSGFVAKYVPTWNSPDVKLLKKNHTKDTRRSDNKVDGWSKDDFVQSVATFNRLAARA